MNYAESLNYIESASAPGSKPGLKRISALLEALAAPQRGLKFIHVAGTNGKGSVCCYLESVLQESGIKTGLYTSPHLRRVNERFRFCGSDISDEDLAELIDDLAPVNDSLGRQCTEFELLTAAAFFYYKKLGAEIVILETGLGGRFDATNIIEKPLLSIVSSIGLDHTEILGDTKEKIAFEKAGIFKSGCPALCLKGDESVLEVFESEAGRRGSKLYTADESKLSLISADIGGQLFSFEGKTFKISMLGAHQLINAALAIRAVEILREGGIKIPNEALGRGLEKARLSSRLSILSDKPLFILDGGHNPMGIESAKAALEAIFPEREKIVIFGTMKDKDISESLKLLKGFCSEIVCTSVGGERAKDAAGLYEMAAETGIPGSFEPEVPGAIEKALQLAEGRNALVLCLGSLYLAGPVLDYFEEKKNADSGN